MDEPNDWSLMSDYDRDDSDGSETNGSPAGSDAGDRRFDPDYTVLIVDDDPQVLDLFDRYVSSQYSTRTYRSGRDALDEFDDTIDVVLLDRRMPDMPGDEFLHTIREQGYECPVAMVTAVEPDLDILALGFDDYVVKPVLQEELLEVVAELIQRLSYEGHINEWLALLTKKATLERVSSEAELLKSSEYRALLAEIDDLGEVADAELGTLSGNQLDALFRSIDSDLSEAA